MRKLIALLLLTGGTALAAPIPEDKRALCGEWEGHGITLSISEAGQISYKKQSGSFTKSISGFFTGFEGKELKVNAFITTLSIKIDEPPHLDRGVWVMTVNGEQVLKKTEGSTVGRREHITTAIRADIEGKGVKVKSLFCPADAETASLFACVLTTEVGDVFPVKCTVDPKGAVSFTSDAALVDPQKLVAVITENFAKKPGGKAEVKCLQGTIMKKPGDSFACVARAKGRDYPVKVTVKDLAGNVSIDY